MTERFWFQNSIEGLYVRGLGKLLGPAEKAALARVGLRVDQLQPAYSEATVLAALRVVGPVVLPNGTWEQQLHRLGVLTVVGYVDTVLGRALAGMLRVVGPERGIGWLDRNMRSLTNYLNVRVLSVSRGERTADIEVAPVGELAHFLVGIFDGSGSLQSDGGARATLVSHDGERCIVRLKW